MTVLRRNLQKNIPLFLGPNSTSLSHPLSTTQMGDPICWKMAGNDSQRARLNFPFKHFVPPCEIETLYLYQAFLGREGCKQTSTPCQGSPLQRKHVMKGVVPRTNWTGPPPPFLLVQLSGSRCWWWGRGAGVPSRSVKAVRLQFPTDSLELSRDLGHCSVGAAAVASPDPHSHWGLLQVDARVLWNSFRIRQLIENVRQNGARAIIFRWYGDSGWYEMNRLR